MKWSSQDLAKLWVLMDKPRNFLLLDAVIQEAVVYLVAQRRWAKGGFRAVYLGEAKSIRSQAPAVMIHKPDDSCSAGLAVQWMAKRGTSAFKIVQLEDNGDLRFEGTSLPVFKNPMQSRCTAVTVIGFNRRDIAQTDLPVTVDVTSEDPSDLTRFVEISARCQGENIPAPAWFRLMHQGGPLNIDILPGLDADQWQIALTGHNNNVEEIPAPESPFKDDPPSRIALVFDRTCPASEHWTDAKLLMSSTHGNGGYKQKEDGPPIRKNPSDFNRQIIDGVRVALVRKLGQSRALDIFYFADSIQGGIGHDIDPLPLIGLVRSLQPPFDERSFEAAEGLLSYCPGLDVWDPLQQAFQAAFNHLHAGRKRFGILIVGNSPPDFPSHPSPLQKIAEVFGYPTSFRRQSSLFGELLASCMSLHIPVVYLFLTQQYPQDCQDPETQREIQVDFNRFRQLETRIQNALEECEHLTVIQRDANTADVAKGIEEAIDLLDDPGIPRSTVRVK